MKANAYVNLSKEYDAVTEEAKVILDDLQSDYESAVSSNAFYQKSGVGKLIKAIFWLIVVGLVFLVSLDIVKLPDELKLDWKFSDYFGELVLIALAIFAICNIYGIFRFFYSKTIERYQGRITRIRNDVQQRIDAMHQQNFYQETLVKLRKGENIIEENPNDVGEKISVLRKEMWRSTNKSRKIDKVIRIVTAVLIYLLGFVVFLRHQREWRQFSEYAIFWVTALGLYYCFALDLVIIKAGQYMGKLMRPIGCLLVLVYGVFLYFTIGTEYTASVLNFSQLGEHPKLDEFLTVGNIIIILQVVGMLIGVLFGDFLGMKQKWEGQSFQLLMHYGDNKTKTRGSVIRRSVLMIIFLLSTCLTGILDKQMLTAVIPSMWWVTNPLMKPFGSTLYQYYGRAKCIGMQFVFFSIFLTFYIEQFGRMGIEELVSFGIAFVSYLIIGGVAKVLNDFTPIFFFINPLI